MREVISKVQTMRKEAGFEVTDHIKLSHMGNDVIAGVIQRNAAEIAANVLADEICAYICKPAADHADQYEKEWDINGETVTLAVRKLC